MNPPPDDSNCVPVPPADAEDEVTCPCAVAPVQAADAGVAPVPDAGVEPPLADAGLAPVPDGAVPAAGPGYCDVPGELLTPFFDGTCEAGNPREARRLPEVLVPPCHLEPQVMPARPAPCRVASGLCEAPLLTRDAGGRLIHADCDSVTARWEYDAGGRLTYQVVDRGDEGFTERVLSYDGLCEYSGSAERETGWWGQTGDSSGTAEVHDRNGQLRGRGRSQGTGAGGGGCRHEDADSCGWDAGGRLTHRYQASYNVYGGDCRGRTTRYEVLDFTYDDSGRVTEAVLQHDDAESPVVQRYVSRFHDNGELARLCYQYGDGSLWDCWYYNSQGQLVATESRWDMETPWFESRWCYHPCCVEGCVPAE